MLGDDVAEGDLAIAAEGDLAVFADAEDGGGSSGLHVDGRVALVGHYNAGSW